LIMVLIGLAYPLLKKMPIGRLPGDISLFLFCHATL